MSKENRPLEEVNKMFKNTLMETLRMTCTEAREGHVVIKMPVNASTHQPMGVLHGGASAALIESVASIGSEILIDTNTEIPLGLEINANHVGSASSGTVVATATIIHRGSKTHVWGVEVRHEESHKLVCVGRVTMIILPRK